ncbi:MAG: type II toxin-antitoxin system RelE/ParE family toxin [Saprospiraceae bacterium]|nr:type II toxin-antitoxin system RelE/ParE family toxin [Saprospiraceae bacterium]
MEIRFAKTATFDLNNILEYHSNEWGEKAAVKFQSKLEHLMNLISSNSYLGVLENSWNRIYGILLIKNVRVYYRIRDEKLIIPALKTESLTKIPYTKASIKIKI